MVYRSLRFVTITANRARQADIAALLSGLYHSTLNTAEQNYIPALPQLSLISET